MCKQVSGASTIVRIGFWGVPYYNYSITIPLQAAQSCLALHRHELRFGGLGFRALGFRALGFRAFRVWGFRV